MRELLSTALLNIWLRMIYNVFSQFFSAECFLFYLCAKFIFAKGVRSVCRKVFLSPANADMATWSDEDDPSKGKK